MKTRPFCSGQTDIDTVIRHLKAVESWRHLLERVVEMGIYVGCDSLLARHVFARIDGLCRIVRHQKDIAEVTDSRTGKMCVRETDHESVGILVARAPVPCIADLLRSHLDHSVRDIRSDKDMSMSAGSDKRINE